MKFAVHQLMHEDLLPIIILVYIGKNGTEMSDGIILSFCLLYNFNILLSQLPY